MRVTPSASIARTCSSSICAIRFAMVMTFMGTWEARRYTSTFVDLPSDIPRPTATRRSWPTDLHANAAREGMGSG
jgi:hypothetical protein